MVSLKTDAEIAEEALTELECFYRSALGKLRTLRIFDRERGHFLLMNEGWKGYERIHSVWLHIELQDDKFYVHEDGTAQGVANLLLAAGVPHHRIVLAMDAPSVRSFGDFAVA